MMCALGILLALIERGRSGLGQVVQADMVSNVRYLSTHPFLLRRQNIGSGPRGENLLDGGAPFYNTYETADGKYTTLACLEPRFYRIFLQTLLPTLQLPSTSSKSLTQFPFPPPSNIGYPHPDEQMERSTWPALRSFLTMAFRSKTRKEWEVIFEGKDACCLPVLEEWEVEKGEVPGIAPKLAGMVERDVQMFYTGEREKGGDSTEVLLRLGLGMEEVEKLIADGVVGMTLASKL